MDRPARRIRERHGNETARAALWPMPVEEFLSGPYLRRADVVLTRKSRDLRSWLIRWATQGSFSHAALVFLVPHQEQGFDNTFVIEAAAKGVDLANLADYLSDRRTIVGIKRVPARWFDKDLQCLVRGRMLNSIQSRYSYATAIDIGLAFLGRLAFGVRSRVQGTRKAISDRRRQALAPPNEFICSGLVQLGFLHAITEQVAAGTLEPRSIADIVFHEEVARFLPEDWDQFTPAEQHEIMWDLARGFGDVLEAVTPEHLACSPRLEWVYVVRDQRVFPVSTEAEARALLDWRP